MQLFTGEELIFSHLVNKGTEIVSDEKVNEKYSKGDVRIITEQARYPLNSIVLMIESGDYELDPEFQRRHRWNPLQKSKLIESFIMNVPVPPIFLYEDRYSHYQVMDGLQRLTAINEFYTDKLVLEGLEEWVELNGRTYSQLPEQIKRGVNRRYLSSIILLQETAKSKTEATRLKQLVFERINSGGVGLAHQESRNAIYDGPLNKLCIRLARNQYLCETWQIPLPTEKEIARGHISEKLLRNETYRTMSDVEHVLHFFAYRQRKKHDTNTLYRYWDNFLKYGNLYDQEILTNLESLFQKTIELVFKVFGRKAFWLYRLRNHSWVWYQRPTTAIYDPLMFVFSGYLSQKKEILARKDSFNDGLTQFYQDNYQTFSGRNINPGILNERDDKFISYVNSVLGL